MNPKDKARYDFLTDLAALLTNYKASIELDIGYNETILGFDIGLEEKKSCSNTIAGGLSGLTEITVEDILVARNSINTTLTG